MNRQIKCGIFRQKSLIKSQTRTKFVICREVDEKVVH